MDRFILQAANALTLLFILLACLVLFFAVMSALTGDIAIGDFVLAGALTIVPYCLTGTLHRIVEIGRN